MGRLARVAVYFAAGFIVTALARPAMAQSDAERQHAYDECTSAFQNQMNRSGIAFVVDLVTANWVAAGIAWGGMIITDAPHCRDLLSEAQRNALDEKSARSFQHEFMDRHAPR